MSAGTWRLLFATPPLCHAFVVVPIADLASHCHLQAQLPRRPFIRLSLLFHPYGLDRLDLGFLHGSRGKMARRLPMLWIIGHAHCHHPSCIYTQGK